MVYKWENKVVIITGGASGLGALLLRKLVEFENVKHVTIFDINEEGAALEQELNSKFGSGKVKFVKCDVTKDDEVDAGLKSVVDRFGQPDVLVNNAGILNDGYHAYKKMVEVNNTALFTCTLKALEIMRQDQGGKGGTIINIASIACLFQHAISPMYFATKSAVLQFTLCLSQDDYFLRTGVRFLTMCFGCTGTTLLTPQRMGNFDKDIENGFEKMLSKFYIQKPENAVIGLIDAYKNGENGSTWLANDDKPVKNISEAVAKAYKILSDTMN